MWSYDGALSYFDAEVLHNQSWLDADEATRNRALKNAEAELYTNFPRYKIGTNPLPEKAVYEQSLWLLRMDDNIQRAELGVTNVNLAGAIQMTVSGGTSRISPVVIRMLGRRRGRYA